MLRLTTRQTKQFVKRETLLFLNNSMVQPYFEYCSLVLGNCRESLKEKLQKLQNRATRVITVDTYDIPVRSKYIFKKFDWKNLSVLSEKRKSKCVCFKTYYRKYCPENIAENFKMSNSERYDLSN